MLIFHSYVNVYQRLIFRGLIINHFAVREQVQFLTSLISLFNIGVTITQGNLCPRFCRYKSDFRTQNYKSGVSQEKNLQKNVPVRKTVPTKVWGFYSLVLFFEIALNFHFCRALFTCWLITSVVKFKVLFLDGPRAQDIFVVNLGLIYSLKK